MEDSGKGSSGEWVSTSLKRGGTGRAEVRSVPIAVGGSLGIQNTAHTVGWSSRLERFKSRARFHKHVNISIPGLH